MKKLAKNDEIDITDRAQAREIIQVVLDYGVSQDQIYHMIALLSLELENVQHMKEITKVIKSLTSKDKKETGLIIGD
tara:strand:+ start:3624 stop:3854 length:231 start_codon:yes stop_codon:yes gene_type:complete